MRSLQILAICAIIVALDALDIDVDVVMYRRLTKPFAHLLEEDLFARLEREMKNPAP